MTTDCSSTSVVLRGSICSKAVMYLCSFERNSVCPLPRFSAFYLNQLASYRSESYRVRQPVNGRTISLAKLGDVSYEEVLSKMPPEVIPFR